jgi:hypothetical protein
MLGPRAAEGIDTGRAVMQLYPKHCADQGIGGRLVNHQGVGGKATERRERSMPGRPHDQPLAVISLDSSGLLKTVRIVNGCRPAALGASCQTAGGNPTGEALP